MVVIVNVLFVVDTETLLAETADPSQDWAHPTDISASSTCFLIASPNLIQAGQATGALELDVAGASTISPPRIRWRSLSLAGGGDASAILYRVDCLAASGQAGPVAGPSRAFEPQDEVPLPILDGSQNTAPPSFTLATVRDYYLESGIRRFGAAPFAFSFYVTQSDAVGKPALAGYFLWRGSLTLTREGDGAEAVT